MGLHASLLMEQIVAAFLKAPLAYDVCGVQALSAFPSHKFTYVK